MNDSKVNLNMRKLNESIMDRKATRITIITSTLNCARALKITADSIRKQNYKNIQWIVADGDSEDGTLAIIAENSDIIDKWFSEQDTGIYSAWNKACEFIDGAWVIFLGAGDILETEETLAVCSIRLNDVPVDYSFAFGRIKIKNENGYTEVSYSGQFCPVWMDLNYSTPPHSSVFTRACILKKNRFDERLKIVADKKFMNEFSDNNYYNLNIGVTIMDGEGISHDLRNISIIWKENILISKDGPKVPFFHFIKAYIVNYRNLFRFKLNCIINRKIFNKR